MVGPVRAVLVDADGVLQVNPEGWLDDVRAFVPHDGEAFTDHLFAVEQRAMTGSVRFVEVLGEVTEQWGIGHRAEELLAHWRRAEVCPGTVEVVRDLQATGVACHLVTNQNDVRAAYLRDGLGYADLLDGVFASCEVGVRKDDPGFFAHVLAELGRAPGEALRTYGLAV